MFGALAILSVIGAIAAFVYNLATFSGPISVIGMVVSVICGVIWTIFFIKLQRMEVDIVVFQQKLQDLQEQKQDKSAEELADIKFKKHAPVRAANNAEAEKTAYEYSCGIGKCEMCEKDCVSLIPVILTDHLKGKHSKKICKDCFVKYKCFVDLEYFDDKKNEE